jgi:hypothetical protein
MTFDEMMTALTVMPRKATTLMIEASREEQ